MDKTIIGKHISEFQKPVVNLLNNLIQDSRVELKLIFLSDMTRPGAINYDRKSFVRSTKT